MTARELIQRAKNTKITQQKVDEMLIRIQEKEKLWIEQSKANSSKKFLDRIYSL